MVGTLPELWLTSPAFSEVWAQSLGAVGARSPGQGSLPIPVGANFRAALTAASAQPGSVTSRSVLGSVGDGWGVGQAIFGCNR